MAANMVHWIVMMANIWSTLQVNAVDPVVLSFLCDWDFLLQSLQGVAPATK